MTRARPYTPRRRTARPPDRGAPSASARPGGPPSSSRRSRRDDFPATRSLSFVDFVGNRQYVSTGNLAENDRVCLLLIDYARRRRVKVWDTARVAEFEAENRRLVALGPARQR